MKLNRYLMITMVMVVLAICTLLSGCASTGKRKEAGAKQESSRQIDNQSTAVEEEIGSSPEVRKEPVVKTGVSGEKPQIQAANLNAGNNIFKHNAMYLKQALDRILPTTLPELNWNRIATVLAGILVILMIYGLAFGLARLPLRGQGAGRRGGSGQTGQHARGTVPQ